MRHRSYLSPLFAAALVAAVAAWVLPAWGFQPADASKKGADKKGAEKKSADKKADKKAAGGEKDTLEQWRELLARRDKIQKTAESMREEYEAADAAGKKKVAEKFEKLKAEFANEIQPALAKLAPEVFAKDPTDEIAAQFTMGQLLEEKKYKEVVALLEKLKEADKAPAEFQNLILRILVQAEQYPLVAEVADQSEPEVQEAVIGMLLQANQFALVISRSEKLLTGDKPSPTVQGLAGIAHFATHDFEKAKELLEQAKAANPQAPGAPFIDACDDYVEFWKSEQALREQEAQADDLPRVLFKTNKGDIVLELFENEAPNTVANFISLVEAKKYDGTAFHRVIPNFMAQGGDPNSLDDDPTNDGGGGPGYTIPCECYQENTRKHFQGSLSMAHAGKNTGGSQFFLTHLPTSHLNWEPGKTQGNHTVFGRVIKGLDVVLNLRGGDPQQQTPADKIISAKVLRKRDHEYVVKKSEPAAGGKKGGGKTTKGKAPPRDDE